MEMGNLGLGATHVLIDHDTKCAGSVEAVFESQAAEVKRAGTRASNVNVCAERWAQTLRQERLNHVLILGECHPGHLVRGS